MHKRAGADLAADLARRDGAEADQHEQRDDGDLHPCSRDTHVPPAPARYLLLNGSCNATTRTLPLASEVRWSAVLAGTFAFFAVLVVVLALSSASALVELERGEFPSRAAIGVAGVLTLAGVLLAYFVAGYVAGLTSGTARRRHPVFHGLLTWAVVAAIVGVTLGNRVALVAGGLFAGRSASALVEEMNPRVVSDLKLLDGKVTSRVVTSPVPEGLLGSITELEERVKEIARDPALRRTARELRQLAAAGSWAGVLILVAGAATAAAGASLATQRRRPAVETNTALLARAQRDPA